MLMLQQKQHLPPPADHVRQARESIIPEGMEQPRHRQPRVLEEVFHTGEYREVPTFQAVQAEKQKTEVEDEVFDNHRVRRHIAEMSVGPVSSSFDSVRSASLLLPKEPLSARVADGVVEGAARHRKRKAKKNKNRRRKNKKKKKRKRKHK